MSLVFAVLSHYNFLDHLKKEKKETFQVGKKIDSNQAGLMERYIVTASSDEPRNKCD